MMIDYGIILGAAFIAVISPGPATLAIASTAMHQGRLASSVLAVGIVTGGTSWSCAAAIGASQLILQNHGLIEVFRFFSVSYLFWLAYQSWISSRSQKTAQLKVQALPSLRRLYFKGVFIQISNPKAILFFTALYTIGVPAESTVQDIGLLVLLIFIQSLLCFQSYALLFSHQKISDKYLASHRRFDQLFSLFFAFTGVKVLFSNLS